MRTGTIYGLLCPIEKRIVYVGQTEQCLSDRLAVHKSKAKKKGSSKRAEWLHDVFLNGLLDSLYIIPLQERMPIDKLTTFEDRWIAKFLAKGSLYNSERKNTYNRAYDASNGLRALRVLMAPSLRNKLKTRVKRIGLKAFSEISGVGVENISIAINSGIATEVVQEQISIGVGLRIYKKKVHERTIRTPKNPKCGLKKRPDAENWINKQSIAA